MLSAGWSYRFHHILLQVSDLLRRHTPAGRSAFNEARFVQRRDLVDTPHRLNSHSSHARFQKLHHIKNL